MLKHQWKHLSNEELLREYQRANAPAFEELFVRTKTLVYNYLLAKLRNVVQADDAFQQTYLRVHRYVASYDHEQSALGWILGIARNVAIDALKKSSEGEVTASFEKASSGEADAMSAIEARQVIQHLIATLSDEERRLLEKRFLEDFSYEEIAQDLGISVDGVRQRVSRLLRHLKATFSESLSWSSASNR